MLAKNKIFPIILHTIIDEMQDRSLNTRAVRRECKKRRRKILLSRKVRRPTAIQKIENYMCIINKYSDETFTGHFRVNRKQFHILENELKSIYRRGKRRPKVPLKKGLLLTLWTLATKDTFRSISDRFNTSKGCAHSTFLNTCKALCRLAPKYIKWPKNDAEFREVSNKFDVLRGSKSFPDVIGCVDGTHIEIPAPKDDKISYYNRKGYYSLILQGVCDSQYRFMNVFFGWPGSTHDARVWENSHLGQRLNSGTLIIPGKYHLLGDMAYPLYTYLLTPHKDDGNLSKSKTTFNAKLSSTRIVIEQSFCLLKGRFRRLKFMEICNLSNAKYIVISAVVLHNFIIDTSTEQQGLSNDSDESSEESISEDEIIYESYLLSSDRNLQEVNKSGKQKRVLLRNILM